MNSVPSPSYKADGRWESVHGSVLVEVKRTNSVRDVRNAFLELAYLLNNEPGNSQAVCVVVDSRLSYSRLQEELHKFRAVVHPDIARRVHFLANKGSHKHNTVAFEGSMTDSSGGFYEWLSELVAIEQRVGDHARSLAPRQIVMATLAQLRLRNHAPVTVKSLQETCGASYPTVAAVLKSLADKGMLEESGERGVRLRYLTSGEWMALARDHMQQRGAHFFTDPTRQCSPQQMARRLAHLQQQEKIPPSVRIGGVAGASHHYPDLDITAPPRLDLSVEADPARIATMLDAGLVPKTKPDQAVALAMHLYRDLRPKDIAFRQPEPWAGELDCLADLIEMGFTREADGMAHHIAVTNKEGQEGA